MMPGVLKITASSRAAAAVVTALSIACFRQNAKTVSCQYTIAEVALSSSTWRHIVSSSRHVSLVQLSFPTARSFTSPRPPVIPALLLLHLLPHPSLCSHPIGLFVTNPNRTSCWRDRWCCWEVYTGWPKTNIPSIYTVCRNCHIQWLSAASDSRFVSKFCPFLWRNNCSITNSSLLKYFSSESRINDKALMTKYEIVRSIKRTCKQTYHYCFGVFSSSY